MDAAERTRVLPGRAGLRVRRALLGDGAPLSARAHATLLLAAMLLGAALAAAIFVGVWRDTATRGDRAAAEQAATRKQVDTARTQLADAAKGLALTRKQLALAREKEKSLARLRRKDAAALAAAAKRLDAAAAQSAAAARSAATLESELKALAGYLQTTPASGLDAGFMTTQVDYMLRRARALAAGSSR
jgi:hypothetical protein